MLSKKCTAILTYLHDYTWAVTLSQNSGGNVLFLPQLCNCAQKEQSRLKISKANIRLARGVMIEKKLKFSCQVENLQMALRRAPIRPSVAAADEKLF